MPEKESAGSVEEEKDKPVSQSEFKLEETEQDIFVEAAVNSANSPNSVEKQATATFGVLSNSQ